MLTFFLYILTCRAKWYNSFNTLLCRSIYDNWKPSSISELTPIIFNTGLTHLGSKVSIYNSLIISYNFLVFGEMKLNSFSLSGLTPWTTIRHWQVINEGGLPTIFLLNFLTLDLKTLTILEYLIFFTWIYFQNIFFVLRIIV